MATHTFLSNFEFITSTPERRFHAYCVGLPRSGTHSIAYLFGSNFKSAHEPWPKWTVTQLLHFENDEFTIEKMNRILQYRDKILRLEIESSHYLHHVTPLLVEIFPQSKFILTVREPLGWLESEVNQNLGTRESIWSRALEQKRYGRYNNEYHFEKVQYIDNVYPIKSYLDYWVDHVDNVLTNVPNDRLIVLDTYKLNNSIGLISRFIGTGNHKLDRASIHSGKKNSRLSIYSYINRNDVVDLLQSHPILQFIKRQLPFLLQHMPYV